MDTSTPIILKFEVPEFKKLIIDAADGIRYHSDLSSLSGVYCFPKEMAEWKKVSVDSFGLSLIWSSRFEVHMDQVIGLAFKTEKIQQTA